MPERGESEFGLFRCDKAVTGHRTPNHKFDITITNDGCRVYYRRPTGNLLKSYSKGKALVMRSRMLIGVRVLLILVLVLSALPLSTAQQNTECNSRVTLLQVNDVYQFTPVD